MSRPVEDIFTIGLDMLSAAVDASTEASATEAVRAIASDQTAEDLRRVVTMLAVETVWQMRPRNSRRKVRDYIERRRFAALIHDWEHKNV